MVKRFPFTMHSFGQAHDAFISYAATNGFVARAGAINCKFCDNGFGDCRFTPGTSFD